MAGGFFCFIPFSFRECWIDFKTPHGYFQKRKIFLKNEGSRKILVE